MCEIVSWNEISDRFREGLILGNGASIAVSDTFAYTTIFGEAVTLGHITPQLEQIFEHLDTADFELVLNMLMHAARINEALEIADNAETTQAYEQLRNALVQTIGAIHPGYQFARDYLLNIAEFSRHFETIASLNYDLILYWAMLLGNDEWGAHWLKDCFIGREFDSDWERFRNPHGNADSSTLVFYPHGNLVLATDLVGAEYKMGAGDFAGLLDTVTRSWEDGRYTPLFVSEGASEQKLAAIRRSSYLSTVYDDVLPELGSRIAIYGWSIGDNDRHILHAIAKADPVEIAVSVDPDKDRDALDDQCADIERKLKRHLGNRDLAVTFYDRGSGGCWCHDDWGDEEIPF